MIGVVAAEKILRIEILLPGRAPHVGVEHRPGGVGGTVFAVGAAGEQDQVLKGPVAVLRQLLQRRQNELLVASPQAAPAGAYQDALGEGDVAKTAGMTPPVNAPAAKLDKALMAKEALGKKAFVSGPKKAADWSNAGAGAGFERAKDAEDEALAREEKKAAEKKTKSYAYEQRDAMTQMAKESASAINARASA